jgi:D-glycero-alpha-D-manno-heptose-7-phosphate kinase
MIITRTPLRISFCGGGSDLPSYYRHETGAVIGAAINKYVYVALKHEYTGRVLAHYRATEDVATVAELKHDRMRACLERWGFTQSVEVTSMADVPGNTGLGSSSAFTVGLLGALDHHVGICAPDTQIELAREACRVEIDDLRAPIGKQDQYLTALGGLRFLQFHGDETVEIDSVTAPAAFLSHLLLLGTPLTHDASAILAHQARAMDDEQKRAHVRALVDLAYGFRQSLEAGQLHDCGHILSEAWQRKRAITDGITNDAIDTWYGAALSAGAWGGKLCGAGGGGFLLVLAPPERHDAIVAATGLRALPFAFDFEGTQVIYS